MEAVSAPVLYPNPSDGSRPVYLRLVFRDAQPQVKIRIFTIANRKVRETTHLNVQAGANDLPVDLTDDWGTVLANGLYYVVVNAGDFQGICKLLVIR